MNHITYLKISNFFWSFLNHLIYQSFDLSIIWAKDRKRDSCFRLENRPGIADRIFDCYEQGNSSLEISQSSLRFDRSKVFSASPSEIWPMRKVKSRPKDWAGPDLERHGRLKNLNSYHLSLLQDSTYLYCLSNLSSTYSCIPPPLREDFLMCHIMFANNLYV